MRFLPGLLTVLLALPTAAQEEGSSDREKGVEFEYASPPAQSN